MPSATFLRIGVRYLQRHRWQSALMIVGITLGVAVVVAIDIANEGAGAAFDLSTQAVAGRATHQIVGGPGGLPQDLYVELRRAGYSAASAPVVTDYVTSPQLGDRPLQLLGVDPFAEAPFRNYLGVSAGSGVGDLTAFLAQPGAVLLSTGVAAQYGLATGDQLDLSIGGIAHRATIAGLIEPVDKLSRRALAGLVLADIATAQELTGRLGVIDYIDLILPEDAAALEAEIAALLPTGARLQPAGARNGAIEQMTAAFRTNLTALSLLALLVGMFLIYNTMTFSVVQRRPLFGTLRCLGVTRREVFQMVIAEAVIVGVVGSLLGLTVGIVLGQGALRMVTRTVNDLYFAVTVNSTGVPASSLIKGALLGVVATVLTAAPPAWEAASAPPRAALSRSVLEQTRRRAVRWTAIGGVALALAGGGLLVIPVRSIALGFAGIFAVLLGFALLAPAATLAFMQGATAPAGRVWGAVGRMAPRGVINALSRTSIAVAALMVAVSVTIGVGVMIGSFRFTVVKWLEQTLQGDVYISPPAVSATQTTSTLDADVAALLQDWPGVARVDVLRSATVDAPDGPVHVAATNNVRVGDERLYASADLPPDEIWAAMEQGAVVVSEPFAYRVGLPRTPVSSTPCRTARDCTGRGGATVTLFTDAGAHTFPVVGVYYDYSSSQGTVLMALPVYRRYWQDTALSAAALQLQPGADPDAVMRELQTALAGWQRLDIRANRSLREEVLVVFDRTFAITGALQLLATVVAFAGVLSALLALQLEKKRMLGILRAVGLTARQLWGLVLLETGLMGVVAGLLAMPTGYVVALILIYVINRRSFGWTLQLQLEPGPFVQALVVAVLAALLAGLYPARKIGSMAASDAIRYE